MTKGCEWHLPRFRVFMGRQEKQPDKCLRCKRYKGKKHKQCKFEDRGFILIDRRHK
jgi:hypothetical protein